MTTPPPPKRFRRLKRAMLVLASVAVLALAGLELFARFYLGLGSPVLYVADPDTEYRLRPNQDVRRIGNHIVVNQWSQRSAPVEKNKTDPRELRVLLMGDSIVYCGSQVDQADTIGSVLERLLAQRLSRPVRVLSIATGSWGPANVVAYLHKFGTFDADAVVWVFSSGDWYDEPSFQVKVGENPQYPSHNPVLASWEGWDRYAKIPTLATLHRLLARIGLASDEPVAVVASARVEQHLQDGALREGLRVLTAADIPVSLWHWPSRVEVEEGYDESAWRRFTEPAHERRVPVTDWTPALRAMPDRGQSLYLSANLFHVSEEGAAWIAHAVLSAVLGALPAIADHPTATGGDAGPGTAASR